MEQSQSSKSNLFTQAKGIFTNKFYFLILGILTIRALIPFEEDQKISLAASKLSEFNELNFPKNILTQFELKPWFSRLTYYIIFRFSSSLSLSHYTLVVVSQAVIFLLITFPIFLCLPTNRRNSFGATLCIGVLLVSPEVALQNEYLAFIFGLVLFRLMSNATQWHTRTYVYFSLNVFCLVALKGITVFYLLPILILFLGTHQFFSMKILMLSTLISTILAIFSTGRELLDSARLQGASSKSILYLLDQNQWELLLIGLKRALVEVPLIIALPVSLFLIRNVLKSSQVRLILLINCMYVAALFFQPRFTYHYLFFAFEALIFLLYYFNSEAIKLLKRKSYKVLLSLTLGFSLFCSFLWGVLIQNATSSKAIFSNNEEFKPNGYFIESFRLFKVEERDSRSIRNLTGDYRAILFLTDGVINFYLPNQSACREFFPISVQRMNVYAMKDESIAKRAVREKDCYDGYRGRHIILQKGWFPIENLSLELRERYMEVGVFNLGERKLLLLMRRDSNSLIERG